MFHPHQPLRLPLLLALSTVVAALFGGCGLLADPGYVLYTVGQEGERDIAVVRPDGQDQRIVITHPSDNFAPVWSPSRQKIAFLSNRDGNVEVYVAAADGSHAMRSTNTKVAESDVVWSPDGERLAYVSPDHEGIPQVFWLRLSDLIPHRLEFSSAGEAEPAWSPDGHWIAFVTLDEDGKSLGIRLRNPDGVNQIRVSEGRDWSPAWSPDGRKLAFVSTRDGQEEIYVVDIAEDGTAHRPRRVTTTEVPARNYAPKWSPDSRRIAFLSDRDGSTNIYTISERGTDLTAVTRNDVEEVALAWGQDGSVVFESRPTGLSSLFIAGRDGVQSALTAADRPASQPDW